MTMDGVKPKSRGANLSFLSIFPENGTKMKKVDREEGRMAADENINITFIRWEIKLISRARALQDVGLVTLIPNPTGSY